MPTRKIQAQAQAQAQAAPKPQAADVVAALVSVSETPAERIARLKAAAQAAQAQAAPKGPKGPQAAPKPINWPQAVTQAAADLGDLFGQTFRLPNRSPVRGLATQGICAGRRYFASAPTDLSAINLPIPTNDDVKRADPMLNLVRSIIHNDYHGEVMYEGESLANGGEVSLSDILVCLQLSERYAQTKWAQTLVNEGAAQTCLMHQLAKLSGRYVTLNCETFKVKLLTDFYAV